MPAGLADRTSPWWQCAGLQQPVLAPLTEAADILVLTQAEGTEDEVRDLLPDIAGITRSVGFRAPDGELNCIMGIGSGLWGRLFGLVDGTENPTGPAAVKAVTVGAEDPGFAGGSYLVVQKYLLRNMFVGSPEGNTDRILDFSTAITGSLFFVPTADLLDDLPERKN